MEMVKIDEFLGGMSQAGLDALLYQVASRGGPELTGHCLGSYGDWSGFHWLGYTQKINI